jgi:hypothetical protein
MVRATGFIAMFIVAVGAAAVAAESTNLLRNGSFEEPATEGAFNEAKHWKMTLPDAHGDSWGSASREKWRSVDGAYIGAVLGIWADRGAHGGIWQEVEAEPGTAYRFSGSFFCDPEWTAKIQEIKLEFWDAAYTTLLDEARTPIVDCDMTWKSLAVKATAPAGAVWARVVVNVVNAGASGALQIDDLKLVAITKETP